MPTLAELLRALSERGEPRGAPEVFSAATSRTSRPSRLVLAAAAAVLVLVAAAVGFGADSQGLNGVAAPDRAQIDDPARTSTPREGARAEPGDGPEISTDSPDPGAVTGLGDGQAVATHLESYRSCDAVLDRLRSLGVEAVGPYGFESASTLPVDTAAGDAESAAPAAGDAAPHSGSNVQEPGIDEADLAKTDGTILVAIARGRLQVVAVADRSLLSSSELPVQPSALFLVDDTVVVIGGAVWGGDEDRGPETPVVVVDIGDPAEPSVRSTTWIEGVVRSSRLQGGVVRLVTADSPRFAWASPSDGSDAAVHEAEAENRRMVERSVLDTWLPDYRTVDAAGHVVAAGLAASCRSTYTPSEQSGFDTTTVVTLDPRTATLEPGTIVAATPIVVYATDASLYVASTTCCSEPARHASDIHRFDLSDPTAAPYASSGSVKGFPVDQFALSERAGHLRVATTYVEDPTRGEEGSRSREAGTDSAIWVLAEAGPVLETVASVTGLGEAGERIHAVRYHDDHAYVVTFRRTDPLYVVDLRDPRAPTLRGELHIPGFSTFLQHVGEGRLMGVGRDADEEGRARGLQLSLFDVTDPASPTRTHVLGYEHGGSPAEHDHLAFLHWAPTDLVVVPLFEARDAHGCDVFAGAVMIHVDGTSLSEVGRVSHAPHAVADDGSQAVVPILRSAVADQSLLTISEIGVAFGDLGDGTEQHFVAFQGPESGVEHLGCRPGTPEPREEPDEEPVVTIPM